MQWLLRIIKKSVTRVKYDDNIRCDYKVEDPVTLKDKELEQEFMKIRGCSPKDHINVR